ncbi:MAG: glycosyltransferase, partial [Dysgonamonadaceae bacterium]|nr:glycosyltransferase [Dysgonamonadaceae bacterium]
SDKLLRLGLKLGVLISTFSLLLSIYYLVLYLTGRILVPGYASLVILITFSTGVIITFIGLVGIYIGKLSIHIKNRPKYIIKDIL